jgi:acetate kinase
VGARRLLTINTGSSSLKAALYRLREDATEAPELRAEASRIGGRDGSLRIADARGDTLEERRDDLPDHAAALDALMSWLRDRGLDRDDLAAVGHRIVHGGERHREPQRVTPGVIADLRALVPIDPNHLPQAIAAIEAVGQAYPEVPQVACFDTAFHSRMPHLARLYALPSRLAKEGIVRYGFHGLSYEYVVGELRSVDREAYDERAAEAVALFCYQAKKFLGALAAALGGLDALVFTGGIGEHSATVRERICEGLGFLGIRLDPTRNAVHAPHISPDDAAVRVRVVPTDEDLMVARHTRRIIEQKR